MIAREIIRTILEIAAVCLLIYGFMHEDELVRFENRVFIIVKALWKSRKAARVASATHTGQTTQTKAKPQNQGVYSNVRRFPDGKPITRRRRK